MNEPDFERAVLAMETKLYRTALGILWNDADAADALQNTIFKAWRSLSSLRDEQRFSPWVMRILLNECRSIQRSYKRRTLPLEDAEIAAAPVEDTALRDALRQLPKAYRLPLILHHIDGYELSEIAKLLHLPQSTVRGRLHTARSCLRQGAAEPPGRAHQPHHQQGNKLDDKGGHGLV